MEKGRNLERMTLFIICINSLAMLELGANKLKEKVTINVYRNNLKNWNFGKEAPQNFDSERATIAERQGTSENRNSEVKPT